MRNKNSAIARPRVALSESEAAAGRSARGILYGFLGVLAFSLTLPLTRIAVAELDPLFVGSARAVVAAVLALGVLAAMRPIIPRGMQWVKLAVVGVGVVAGFPFLTSFALQSVSASHGAVVIAVLPVATAVAVVIRTNERPSLLFWIASTAGAGAVVAFIAVTSGGLGSLHPADLLLLGAVALAAIGYAEGALLARELGSWQTICWALVVSLPVMLAVMTVSAASHWPMASGQAWLSFSYLACFSMFLGFFAWYRGLAIGPIARVSQIQLVQPVLSIIWAALILGETLDWTIWAGAGVVLVFAAVAVRARVRDGFADRQLPNTAAS